MVQLEAYVDGHHITTVQVMQLSDDTSPLHLQMQKRHYFNTIWLTSIHRVRRCANGGL